MAHRFKSRKNPITYVPARANKSERELRQMAACIKTQAQLEAIMMQVKPEMRVAGYHRIEPFLPFNPAVDTVQRLESTVAAQSVA